MRLSWIEFANHEDPETFNFRIDAKAEKNLVIASSIVIAVALLTSLSIVSNSANLAIMEIIAKTGHTLTVRPAATSAGTNAEEKSQEYRLTTSEVVLGSYIPEAAVPEIMKIMTKP